MTTTQTETAIETGTGIWPTSEMGDGRWKMEGKTQVDEPRTHTNNNGERAQTVIEFLLTDFNAQYPAATLSHKNTCRPE